MISMKNEIKCPHCKSVETTKRGFKITEAKGKQQFYYCKSCGKRFLIRDAFFRMRNTSKKITLCIDLFYRGVSTRKIQAHLHAFYPHNSCYSSIYRWVIKYSNMMSNYAESLPLRVGSELQMDEVEYKRLGKENWFIDSIDTTTRFIVVSELVNHREERGIRNLLKKAKAKTGNQIEVVTTDGFNMYVNSVKYGFGYNLSKHDYNIVHNVVNASRTGKFNYPIERFHNSLRERTKTMRGFHGSLEAGNSLLRGYIIFYNFIRKHQAINCYPSDLAIPELNLKSENRWLELIEKSHELK